MESLLQFENSLISLTWLAVPGAILIAALYYVCHPAVRMATVNKLLYLHQAESFSDLLAVLICNIEVW